MYMTGLETIPAKHVLLVVVAKAKQNFRSTYFLRQGMRFLLAFYIKQDELFLCL